MSSDCIDNARKAALANLRSLLNPAVLLPDNGFRGSWAAYRFFESDNMFHDGYVAAVKILLAAEKAVAACVVNLDRLEANANGGAVCFLGRDSDPEEYRNTMRRIEVGYVGRERFGSTSDVGSWCSYCENSGDVGVIAIRNAGMAEVLEPALELIWAKPLWVISNGDDPGAAYPFTDLIPEWRKGLASNFQ